jgi:succinate-semialdehyde dehydrogenase/glutarate-semialdehyde dehydrogenase
VVVVEVDLGGAVVVGVVVVFGVVVVVVVLVCAVCVAFSCCVACAAVSTVCETWPYVAGVALSEVELCVCVIDAAVALENEPAPVLEIDPPATAPEPPPASATTLPPELETTGAADTAAPEDGVDAVPPPLEPQPASSMLAVSAVSAASVRRMPSRRKMYVLVMSTIIASDERRVVESVPHLLLIGGEWRSGERGTLDVEDPATGEVLVEVAHASPADAVAALDAAVAAGPEWAAHAPRERGEILRRAFETIVERADDLALLMTLEMGKPLAESRSEIIYAAEFLRWFSEEAVRIEGRYSVSPNGSGRLMTMRQPVGPCLLITPWNFPLAMGTRKVAPALAAGCTVVIKPAQQTPLSTLAFAQILEQSGVPKGVVNVVTSSDAGATTEPLLADQRLRKLSFTGSTGVGRLLMSQASETLLRLSMELGGNAPFLVFDDADLDAAVEGAVLAKMRNGGEACTAANRFHVHESVAADFSERLARRLGAMHVGRGTEANVELGPMIDAKQRDKVAELVDDALERGAKPLTGGSAVDGPGYFYEPTVLGGVEAGTRLLTEEIFGPVAPVISFSSEEEAISAANATEYGLAAYMFTTNFKRAIRVAEALETGMIGLNQGIVSNAAAPFGGIKQSGFGREGGHEGIGEYLETKYLAINMD